MAIDDGSLGCEHKYKCSGKINKLEKIPEITLKKQEKSFENKFYEIGYFMTGALAGVLLLAGSIFYSRTNKSQSPVRFLDNDKDGIISPVEKNLFYKNIDKTIGNNPEKILFYKKIEQLVNDYNSWKP